MTLARPLDWHATSASPPFCCPRCWLDFLDGAIDAPTLLAVIEHPLRRFTSWVCPRCEVRTWGTDFPLHAATAAAAALIEIREHVGEWAVRQGLKTAAELAKERRRDDF